MDHILLPCGMLSENDRRRVSHLPRDRWEIACLAPKCRERQDAKAVGIEAAAGVFDRLNLRTENPQAAQFFEGLAFSACAGQPHCTHILDLRCGRNGLL